MKIDISYFFLPFMSRALRSKSIADCYNYADKSPPPCPIFPSQKPVKKKTGREREREKKKETLLL